MRCALILFIVCVITASYASAIIISEVELNPPGDDSKNEWIELYSASVVNLNGWFIENVKGKNMSINETFSGYKVLAAPANILSNEKQRLALYDSEGNLVDETEVISDTVNDKRSWQFCDGSWKFLAATRGEDNSCGTSVEEPEITRESQKTSERKQNTTKISEKTEEASDELTGETVTEATIPANFTTNEDITPIRLEAKGIKSEEIWKSRTGYIKEYSIVGFTFLCLLALVILATWRRKLVQDKEYGKNKCGYGF